MTRTPDNNKEGSGAVFSRRRGALFSHAPRFRGFSDKGFVLPEVAKGKDSVRVFNGERIELREALTKAMAHVRSFRPTQGTGRQFEPGIQTSAGSIGALFGTLLKYLTLGIISVLFVAGVVMLVSFAAAIF